MGEQAGRIASAFGDLCLYRDGKSPIPLNQIKAYAELFAVADKALFARLIMDMDRAWLEAQDDPDEGQHGGN